jgi:TRAP-type mannitol/chloroaromatic compound transport system permease small subunit
MRAASELISARALGDQYGRIAFLGILEGALGRVVGWVAGALVAAEVVILFAGVVARYVLHSPLVWSDELAATLFLWLAMLGAVMAVRHNAHMRMTAIVAKLDSGPMVVILAMGLGLFSPPFGVGYYAACARSRVNPDEGTFGRSGVTCWRY